MSADLILERAYCYEHGTWGRLTLPNDQVLATIEPPWRGNERGKSCIPEGVYQLAMRWSPIVERTSGGVFERGWEVCDVPERSYIMFHVGNWVRNTEGCVLVGMEHAILDHEIAVADSGEAFELFMAVMEGRQELTIDIRPHLIEFP